MAYRYGGGGYRRTPRGSRMITRRIGLVSCVFGEDEQPSRRQITFLPPPLFLIGVGYAAWLQGMPFGGDELSFLWAFDPALVMLVKERLSRDIVPFRLLRCRKRKPLNPCKKVFSSFPHFFNKDRLFRV